MAAFIRRELSLDLKPTPYINRTGHGMDFLGCRVFHGHLALNRRSRVRFRNKLRSLERAYLNGELDESEPAAARHGDGGVRMCQGRLQLAIPPGRARIDAGERSQAAKRVIRGGSWNNNPRNCRSANRNRNAPDNRNNNLGFRVARAQRGRWIPSRTEPIAFRSRHR